MSLVFEYHQVLLIIYKMKGHLCTVNTAVTSYLSSLPSPNVNRDERQDERAQRNINTHVDSERLEGVLPNFFFLSATIYTHAF
jgi:hypothetical protein